MNGPGPRTSWWDDLAAMCAAPLRAAPRTTLVVVVLLLLVTGRHDLDLATAVQVGAGALLGAAGVRAGMIRAGPFPLWLLPAAAVMAHVLDTPSRFDLGAPLAVAAGGLLLAEVVASRRRLHWVAGAVLVWGGLAAARWQSIADDALATSTLHLLDLGWPLALAGAASMLRGPTRQELSDARPRRPSERARRWLLWGLAPAVVAALPDPVSASPWGRQDVTDTAHLVAFAVVVLATRVADHVVDDARPVAEARERVRAVFAAEPWTVSAIGVAAALGAALVVRDVIGAVLDRDAITPTVYGVDAVWSAYPEILVCGIAALACGLCAAAPRRSRAAPFVAVLTVVPVWFAIPYVPVVIEGSAEADLALRAITWSWLLSLLVPVAIACCVPARAGRGVAVEVLAVATFVAAPIVSYWVDQGREWRLGVWLVEVTALSWAVNGLARRRIGARALWGGALVAAAASTLGIVARNLDWSSPFAPRAGYAPFPSFEHPNQLRVFVPLAVGWGAGLLILLLARALSAGHSPRR